MQSLRGDLVPALQDPGGVAEPCHHVQQDHLRMKAARRPRGLVHNVPGSIREHNENKNSIKAQHAGASLGRPCLLYYKATKPKRRQEPVRIP